MRKIFFSTILLFVLGIGQIWAETRTFDGSTKFYVMNYKPSGLGGSTLWAISDDCKFYFDLVDGSANHHWYEATLVSGSGAYSEGAIYSITPDAGTYSYFIMTRGKGKSFGDAINQTGNIGFHSDASYNLVNGGYDKGGTGTTWGKLTPKSVTSDGTGVLYFNGSPSSATWWKDYGADRQSAYFYNNTSGEFTTTSVLVSGNYYKVTVPEGTWTGVILTRHNDGTTNPSWDNKCNQTQDIPLVDGKNYLSNFGEAPGTYTWEDFIPTGTTVLNGTMNDWSLITAKAFTDGELAITLPARKTMSFKIVEGNNGSGTWYGLTDANCILSDMTDWGLSSSGTNTRINTAGAGTYTFAYNASHQLSVSYPEVKHPNADYVYLIKYGWSSWRIHFEQASTTYGIAKTTWTGQELTVASGTITDTYDYTAPGALSAQTYFYYAVGDYPKFNFNDNSSSNQTNDQTPSPGQYMYNDGDSWEWGSFVYGVTLNTNDGTIWEGNVTSYTFGVGATLPTNVTKWGYDFDGWYDNAELEGDHVTVISTSDTGNKNYYAKWTSIAQIVSHPEFLAAQEGDIITVTVTGVHTSADIYLQYTNGTTITHRSLLEAGTYTFQLSADAAAEIRTHGLMVTGTNFTFSNVDIRYRKTIWEGSLSDNAGWKEVAVDKSIFSGMSGGDFLGFNVTTLGDGASYHSYAMRADYVQQLSGSCTATGIAVEQLSAANITAINNSKTRIDVDAQYLDISNLYSYTHTRVYTVTLNTNDGTINTGNVTAYTFGTGATLPTDVTRTGYTFAGWYPDAEFAGDRVYTISTTDYDAKTYYAKWTVNTYDITLNLNDGTVNDGNVTSYTYGVGATLPTNVTRDGYRFDRWFANEGLTGEPVAGITASDYGNKTYWAKWTSLEQTKTPATYHRLYAAEEGDILVVNVTAVSDGSSIKINKSADGSNLFTKAIAATGKYTFQLNASDATALHTGMILSGTNYTGTVELLLKKTIWSGTLESNTKWTGTGNLGHTGLGDIAEGDYLGFTVSELSDKGDYHQYAMQYSWSNVISSGVSATGTYLEEIDGTLATNLAEGSEAVSLGAAYLTLSELNRYITKRDYTVTLNTNDGTINDGNVTGYIYPEGTTLPTDVTRTGYTFAGWYDNSGLTGDAVTTISTSDYGNKIYYAKWTVNVYTVEEHTKGGKINADSIGNYTYGVGATLPTNVTRWGYKFAGWYDNEDLEGDPVTAISTTDNGDKDYYANWTEISETLLAASGHPEFLAAEEGDILVISVSNTQPRAQIYLQSTDYELCIGSKWIAGTGAGEHVIQLTAAGAEALHTGVIITGENYTKSSVALLYKKTIWSEGVADESGWTYKTISDRTGFAGIEDDDYLGFTVTNLYDKENKDNQYFMQYNNNEFITSDGLAATGTYFEVVPSGGADKLKTGKEDLTIAAKNLTLSELNRYLPPCDYTVTLNTNGGTINAGNVTSYRYRTGATLPTDVTKTGYSFAGWYDNSGLTGDAVTTISTSDYGNKEYWAKWTPVTLTFTGDGGTSYDWFKTSCWSPACIPTIEHDVIIQNKATLYGSYGTGAAYGTGDATTRHAKAKSIKIDKTENENAKIEIWSRASLIVAEGIKVKKVVDEEIVDNQPTTPEDLYITTNILGNGGLICGDASSTTQAEYEFYSKSFKYDTYLVNQYVGIPFASLNANQLYSMNIFVYDDEHDAWKTPESNTLVPFTAYNYINKWSLAYNVYNLTGTLALPGIGEEREKQVLTCGSRYNASGTFDGEGENNGDYMFANSWTAPINIASMTAADFSGTAGADMEQTIYIFNAGWLNPSEDAKKEIGDNAGQWTAFPIASAAGMTNAIIPATQAFCVTAKAANAKLTLDYKKHVYDPAIGADSLSTFATRAPRRERAEETPVRLKMMVHKDSAIADNIYIFEREDFSYDFDNGWDGRKIFGKSLVPQLYTIRWNTNLAVDAVPDMDGTLIGFKAGTDTNSYTFTFEYNGGEPLFLYDQDLNVFTQITSEATYSFTTDDTAAHQRFMLTRSNAPAISTWFETVESESADEVKKMIINDQIFILRGGQMYDVTGKRAQ